MQLQIGQNKAPEKVQRKGNVINRAVNCGILTVYINFTFRLCIESLHTPCQSLEIAAFVMKCHFLLVKSIPFIVMGCSLSKALPDWTWAEAIIFPGWPIIFLETYGTVYLVVYLLDKTFIYRPTSGGNWLHLEGRSNMYRNVTTLALARRLEMVL